MTLNKSVKFKVNGMHCNGCVTKIKNSINALSNDQLTDIDLSSGEVKVFFDEDKMKLSEIKSKIIEAGFSVEGIELE